VSKSRPLYRALRLDACARAHLVVTDLADAPALGELSGAQLDICTVKTIAPGIPAPRHGHIRAFRAAAELLAYLAHRLRGEAVGLRLYAVGSEAFIWDARNIGLAAGLAEAEIQTVQAGSLRRRVYCTHCKTMTEDVTTGIVACRGCGAALLVRDHFSRRLAAFMGVKVDAEVPGEVPAAAVMYP
jgi:hypothetical protein